MSDAVLVGLLALIGSIIGTFGGIITSAKMTNYRLKQLEDRVGEHNNFARRMPVIEEKVKVINNRICDLEQFHKPN